MSGRTTLYLLIAVLIIGTYVVSTDQQENRLERRLRAARQAFNLDPRDVTSVRIESSAGVFVINRAGNDWKIIQPVSSMADADTIMRLLESISELRWTQMITKEQQKEFGLTLDSYGLETPRVSIHVDRGELPFSLLIGHDAPGGTEMYVKRDGIGSVFSVSRDFLEKLPEAANDLRDKRLIAISPDLIRRVEYTSGDHRFHVMKTADERWQLDRPAGARANGAAIRQWLNRVYDFTVDEFITDSMTAAALYGLESPRSTITLIGENAADAHTILIGNPLDASAGTFYAAIPGRDEIVSVTRDIVDALDVKQEQFRDYRLLPFDASEVAAIRMSEDDTILELRRNTQDVWEATAPKPFPADQAKTRALLEAWITASVLRFNDPPLPPLEGFGLDVTNRLIRFVLNGATNGVAGYRDVSVRLGRRDGSDALFAMTDDGGSIMELSPSLAAYFTVNPLYYRDLLVLSVPASNVVRVTQKFGAFELVLDMVDGFFRPAQQSFVPDTDALAAVLNCVESLHAESFIADDAGAAPRYGFDAPFAEIILGLAEGGLNRVLLIGHDDGRGGRYAMVRGSDAIFTLSPATVALLVKPVANALTMPANSSRPELW